MKEIGRWSISLSVSSTETVETDKLGEINALPNQNFTNRDCGNHPNFNESTLFQYQIAIDPLSMVRLNS